MKLQFFVLLIVLSSWGSLTYAMNSPHEEVDNILSFEEEKLVECLWKRVVFITRELTSSSEQRDRVFPPYRDLNNQALQEGAAALRTAWEGLLELARREKRPESPLPPVCVEEAWRGLLNKIHSDVQNLVRVIAQEKVRREELETLLQDEVALQGLQEDEALKIVVEEIISPVARDVRECLTESNATDEQDSPLEVLQGNTDSIFESE